MRIGMAKVGHHGSRRVHGGSGMSKRCHVGQVGGWIAWVKKNESGLQEVPRGSGNTCKIGAGHGGCGAGWIGKDIWRWHRWGTLGESQVKGIGKGVAWGKCIRFFLPFLFLASS